MEEALNRLIDIVATVAPEVWEVAVRQAILDGVAWLVIGVILWVCVAVLFWFARRVWKKKARIEEENKERSTYYKHSVEEEGLMVGLTIICMMFIAIFAAWATMSGIIYIVNPGYHAIDLLFKLI